MSLPVARDARELVMSYGRNATCCQILNPGMTHWFSADGGAVVGYVRRGHRLLVAGGPVCAPETLRAMCQQFESFAEGQRCRVCYVCAEEDLRSVLGGSPNHSAIALGAQPAWDPRHWRQIVDCHASLRAQLYRARNKHVVVEAIPSAQAATNPDLRRVLREWLDSRRLPPLHFLVEPDVLDGILTDRLILVATRNDRPVAFLVASPIAAKNGYLVELLARSPSAPNGTSELLIDAAMQSMADQHRSYVTLGLVAMATAARQEIRRNPWWVRAPMSFARTHANRFYSFRGLEQFRVKMAPRVWEPVFAISNEARFSALTLYNMGAAFSGIPPWLAIGIGIAKAARQELLVLIR